MLILSVEVKAQFFDFLSPFSRSERVENEKMTSPEFKGGNEKIPEYLKKHFRDVSQSSSVSGTIVVACVVNEKGKVVQCSVVRGLDEFLNAEAVEVVKKMKFVPAKKGKTKVKGRCDISIPIRHGRVSYVTVKTQDV